MIYIKNNKETQTIYIPRTELNTEAYVSAGGSYEEGYADGIVEGKKSQKAKLTGLVVSDSGLYEREDGWNRVEVNVTGGDELKTQEKTVVIIEDSQIVYPDGGYDALTKVTVSASNYGQTKRDEGYTDGYQNGKIEGVEEGYANGYEEGVKKGYDDGYIEGKADCQGVTLVSLKETANWEDRDNNDCIIYDPQDYDAEGFDFVSIAVDGLYKQGKDDGYIEGYKDGKSESKIKILDYDVNIQRSTFTAIPDWMDFEGATSLNQTFTLCQYLKSADLPNISSVQSLYYTFSSCYDLERVLLETSNVTNMEGTFRECHALSSVTLTDTSNVKNMSSMFYECWNLRSIPMMNTSKVTSMYHMFYDCGKLNTIPELDTSNVKNMNGMFAGCTGLTSLPVIDATNATDLGYFFGNNEMTNLTSFGGFKNLKTSIDDDYCLAKAPNLDLQSLLNIARNVYDFTANGETPATGQGVLKLHPDVYNQIVHMIGTITNKGWTIIS